MILDQSLYQSNQIRFDQGVGNDYRMFKDTIQGLVYQEDLVPINCALIANLYNVYSGTGSTYGCYEEMMETYKLGKSSLGKSDKKYQYTGQLFFKSGEIHRDLRCSFIGITEKQQMLSV